MRTPTFTLAAPSQHSDRVDPSISPARSDSHLPVDPAVTSATVIPIASGKGGVGKSVFAVGLAAALARLGRKTVLIDLDFGAPNTHSLLGIRNEHPGVGDFLRVRGSDLASLRVETSITDLTFLPGDGHSPLMPSITYAEKLKLGRAIAALPAEFVVLDLGGGSATTTLDLFSMVPRGILLTVPELPTFMNLMAFLRNLVFRRIERGVRGNLFLREYMRNLRGRSIHEETVRVSEILEHVHTEDPVLGERVAEIIRSIRPRLILNFGTDPGELSWLMRAASVVRERLSVQLDSFGFLPIDPELIRAIRQARPVFDTPHDGVAAIAIRRLADRVARLWGTDLENCFERLVADTHLVFEGGGPAAAARRDL